MNILVTGCNGYIGSLFKCMAPDFLPLGTQIYGVDTCFYRPVLPHKRGICVVEDIREATPTLLQGIDVVVYMSDLSNDPMGEMNVEVTHDINHKGAVRFAKMAKEAGVKRFIYMSSCSVYGVAEGVVDETHPVNPVTTYAKCKVMVENDLKEMADEKFCPVFLRNGTVYGWSPNMRFDLVLNNLLGMAYLYNRVTLKSDGSPKRPMLNIKDAIVAICKAIEMPQEYVNGEAFNIHTFNTTIKEIAEACAGVSEETGIEIEYGENEVDERSYEVSGEKATRTTLHFSGIENVYDAVEELRYMYQMYLEESFFKSIEHNRIQKLKALRHCGALTSNLYWKTSV